MMIWGRAGGNWRLGEGWDLIWKNENRKSCSGLSTFIMSWVVQKASPWSYHKVPIPASRLLKYHRTNANPVVFGHYAYILPRRAWALSLTHVVDHNVTTEGPSWWRDHTPLWPHRPPLCTLQLGTCPSHVNGFEVTCHARKKNASERFDIPDFVFSRTKTVFCITRIIRMFDIIRKQLKIKLDQQSAQS